MNCRQKMKVTLKRTAAARTKGEEEGERREWIKMMDSKVLHRPSPTALTHSPQSPPGGRPCRLLLPSLGFVTRTVSLLCFGFLPWPLQSIPSWPFRTLFHRRDSPSIFSSLAPTLHKRLSGPPNPSTHHTEVRRCHPETSASYPGKLVV